MGIYSHQTIVNSDFDTASAWPDSVDESRDMSFAKGSNDVLEETWATLRPTPLTPRAANTYWMVDTIKSMPQYKFLEGFAMLAGTGYVIQGPIEIGPYFDAYSRNAIEGNRFSLGIQTSNDFSKKVWLRSFAAYGVLDQRWKYGGSMEWILRKSPRTEVFVEHARDIDQLGMMGFFDQGNGLNSALQLDTLNRLSEITLGNQLLA